MPKKKVYSHELLSSIEAKIPKIILDALAKEGWNVLGVYEIVNREIIKERKLKKRNNTFP